MREPILLSDHFTIGKLLRFTVPSMVMMVFISIYSVIDGFFVSNFAGTTSFAALNLVFPFVMFLSVTGFVFGAAWATALSQLSGATIPLVYFICPNSSRLRLGRFEFNGAALRQTCFNGTSEFFFAQLLARPLAQIFVGYDPDLLMLTTHALRIYSISFLLMGFNGYASAFFTALNNGLVSAAISTNRTMLCETLAVLLLPLAFGVNGIWHAIIFAEVAALVLTVTMLVRNGKRYGYR